MPAWRTQLTQPDTRRHALRWSVDGMLALYAAWFCWPTLHGYLRVMSLRVQASYGLGWLETYFYRSALAAYQGTPLYGPPNLDYTPPIYNPGLAVTGGALMHLFGPRLELLRMFSFACFLGLALCVAVWSGRAARSTAVGIIAGLLLLSAAGPLKQWTALINTDVPCALCCIVACWLAATQDSVPSRWRIAASALCVVAAFAFKQPGACIALPVAALWLARGVKPALGFAACAAGMLALLIGGLQLSSQGWYLVYALEIPLGTGHRRLPALIPTLLASYPQAWYALLYVPPALTLLGPKHLRALWVPLSAALIAMAYLGFTKLGASKNTLFPAYWGGSFMLAMAPLVTHALLRRWPRAQWLALGLSAWLLWSTGHIARAQLAWYPARAAVLASAALHGRGVENGERAARRFDHMLKKKIRALPKPVFVGSRCFGPGWPLNTHQTALYEGSVRTRVFDMRAVLEPRLKARRYAAMIIWDYKDDAPFHHWLERYYERRDALGRDPLIGLRVNVWQPKVSASSR